MSLQIAQGQTYRGAFEYRAKSRFAFIQCQPGVMALAEVAGNPEYRLDLSPIAVCSENFHGNLTTVLRQKRDIAYGSLAGHDFRK